jgi:hypothetical protein
LTPAQKKLLNEQQTQALLDRYGHQNGRMSKLAHTAVALQEKLRKVEALCEATATALNAIHEVLPQKKLDVDP